MSETYIQLIYITLGLSLPAADIGYTQQQVILLDAVRQRPGGCPAEELLRDWGHRNPTIKELFLRLQRLNMRKAADCLRGIGV